MRKVSPNDVRTQFDDKLGCLLEVYLSGIAGIKSTPIESLNHDHASLCALLAEQCMMAASVAWEVFISELFVCYINKNSAKYTADLKKRFAESIKEKFGDEMATKAVLSLGAHLRKTEVKSSVDPKKYNLVIKDSEKLVEKATAWLVDEHRNKFVNLTPADKAGINAWREIRDFLAHKSSASWSDMEAVLKKNELAQEFRWQNRARHDIGVYLKADTNPQNGVSRLELYFRLMKDIAVKLTN